MNKYILLTISHIAFVAIATSVFYLTDSPFLVYVIGVIAGIVGVEILNEAT